ncbi:right-handed parallel beta-helix repeat-containing protein [Marinilongibacter aquaticus]|uniref:right-handed parallel beta-helix repeat-containing protein n=1 Tax=Marinilongibacter aquaticus TaxID=2975157 RepID=UPI0021BD0867|nr:right-handed parallel beta-helix repeat-containing protein [Marinilongibacter aquaticus]UBM59325.1 right-handed parallel beta-helix repeat-containing protein [Marinilongibacter aquaticus]
MKTIKPELQKYRLILITIVEILDAKPPCNRKIELLPVCLLSSTGYARMLHLGFSFESLTKKSKFMKVLHLILAYLGMGLCFLQAKDTHIKSGLNLASVVVYVDSSASPGGNGTKPTSAYKYLQDALSFAALSRNAVEIRVAKGTYYPDEGTGFTNNNQSAAFKFVSNVTLLGGYATGFPLNKGRNWTQYPSILSGDIQQNGSNKSINVIHNDFTSASPLSNVTMDGFTIQDNSQANGIGGMRNLYSEIDISHCTFRYNWGTAAGAVFNSNSQIAFDNCLFYSNSASQGIALGNTQSTLDIVNCTLYANPLLSSPLVSSNGGSIGIKNSIVWGSLPLEVQGGGASPYHVSYSIISGGYTGTQVSALDPKFADASTNDFRIAFCSPAYNGGNNAFSSETSDLDQKTRKNYDTIDIGAFEYQSDIVHVNKNVAGGNNDGTNWPNAYTYLQDALQDLSACGTPAEVWVANATYYTDEGSGISNNDRSAVFPLLNLVSLYGGFSGNESLRSQRNPNSPNTILSGDIDQNDPFDDYDGNAYRVLSANFNTADSSLNSTLVDGFMIKGGYAKSSPADGGGIYLKDGKLLLANCNIIENHAISGAGISLSHAILEMDNCYFFNNLADNSGGALALNNSHFTVSETVFSNNSALKESVDINSGIGGSAIIGGNSNGSFSDCTFQNSSSLITGGAVHAGISESQFIDCHFQNNTSRKGGAVYLQNGHMTLDNCTLTQNYNDEDYGGFIFIQHGGAIYAINAELTINYSQFNENQTANNGGGIYATSTDLDISQTHFNGNLARFLGSAPSGAHSYGGGIYVDQNCVSKIEACTFHENESFDGGGALFINSDNSTISNCLFYDNFDFTGTIGAINIGEGSGIIHNCTFGLSNYNISFSSIILSNTANFTIANSIFWANANNEIMDNSANTVVENCIVSTGYAGGLQISTENPQFKNTALADFGLKPCSPAIDMGNNTYNTESLDLLEEPRIFNNQIDLGAIEAPYFFQSDCDNCPDQLTMNGNIAEGVWRASETITGEGHIASDKRVTMGANQTVELVPPFETVSGAVFKAETKGCSF